MKKIFYLNGLSCGHCAAKIERDVGKHQGISSATVDFATKRLIVEANLKDQRLRNLVTEIVMDHDADIHVSTEEASNHGHSHDHGIERSPVVLVLSVLAFVVALIIPTGTLRLVMFMTSYVLSGYPVYIASFHSIRRGRIFDENFLMLIASVGALAIGEYSEAAAVMVLFQIGEYLQERAIDKSRRSIQDLIRAVPTEVAVESDGRIQKKSAKEIIPGDIVVIRPGENIAVDGVVTMGSSTIDTRSMTGESLPVEVREGSTVISGTTNLDGLIKVRAEKRFEDTAGYKILQLVEGAGAAKSPIEGAITRFARYYTPIVCVAALILAIVPGLITGEHTLWLSRAMVFLVISCPCALVISVPMAYFATVGFASRHGIMIKGGNYLDAVYDTTQWLFDKTGTLTEGRFKIVDIKTASGYSEDDVLAYAAAIEAYSTHPLAKAVVEASKGRTIETRTVTDMENIPGYGLVAQVDGKRVAVGNRALMEREHIFDISVDSERTVIFVAVEGRLIGTLYAADIIKDGAAETIAKLKTDREPALVTGDRQAVADAVAAQLGIPKVFAQLLPHEKVERVQSAGKQGGVLFVGDGVNDAPALIAADVGVAMGDVASDMAIEAADIILMDGDIRKMNDLRTIAKRNRFIVKSDILFTIGIKVLVLILASFGFVNMWMAVLADVGVCLLAVAFSYRWSQRKL